ncbi:hypothetical protein lerEdw1_002381 [Lerista edwardsae]|nr:hypothetical protein lerEdw1_002383 [Lerista edwardsae]KAJ6650865.1 hypothetical protein lerEdw1_002381 [Lerista edwardsae]
MGVVAQEVAVHGIRVHGVVTNGVMESMELSMESSPRAIQQCNPCVNFSNGGGCSLGDNVILSLTRRPLFCGDAGTRGGFSEDVLVDIGADADEFGASGWRNECYTGTAPDANKGIVLPPPDGIVGSEGLVGDPQQQQRPHPLPLMVTPVLPPQPKPQQPQSCQQHPLRPRTRQCLGALQQRLWRSAACHCKCNLSEML